MPWTAASFRARHNKKLSPTKAKKAAAQANAILKTSGNEGLAIATANKFAKKKRKKKR
jgi:uncharacterized protein YdaT